VGGYCMAFVVGFFGVTGVQVINVDYEEPLSNVIGSKSQVL